jgi:uncharacterized membrane protein YvbJ
MIWVFEEVMLQPMQLFTDCSCPLKKITMRKVTLMALLLVTLFFSCRKESISTRCNNLKGGIVANDKDQVKTAITSFISGLQSNDYTEANINQLCQRISSSCDVQVEAFCFDCIKTLPGQTEIRISVNAGGASTSKIIDLSYTSTNKIVFQNMHD